MFDPLKLLGGLLIALGCAFRAICLAYFGRHERSVPDTPSARRRFESRKQRALVIDALFIVLGVYLVLTH